MPKCLTWDFLIRIPKDDIYHFCKSAFLFSKNGVYIGLLLSFGGSADFQKLSTNYPLHYQALKEQI